MVIGWRWGIGWVVSSVGRRGVWVRGDRAAGAGDEERVLGTMRRSRGDSVSVDVGVGGVAVAAGGGVGGGRAAGAGGEEGVLGAARRSRGGGVSGGVGVWGVAGAAGAGDEERALGAMRRSRGDKKCEPNPHYISQILGGWFELPRWWYPGLVVPPPRRVKSSCAVRLLVWSGQEI